MLENKEFNIRYFNGKSAIPEIGIATIQKSTLILGLNSQILKFPFDSFHQVELFHKGIKLTLKPDEYLESPTIEMFCDKNESKELEKIWIVNKKGENIFQSIGLFFKNINVFTIALLGLIFLFCVGTSFYIALQNIYVLFPIETDDKIGESYAANIQKNFAICNSKETDRFFSLALKELVPKNSKFKYSVQVINLPDENAISLAGGRIYFFSGLMNASKSQEEILGVLAHEISHIEKRHHLRTLIKTLGTSFAISMLVGPGLGDFQTLETITEIGSTIAVLKYSRDFESEADQNAYDLLARANRNVDGLLQFLKRMQKLETIPPKNQNEEFTSRIQSKFINLLSSHPPTEDRILSAEKDKKKLNRLNSKLLVSSSDWTKIKSACQAKDN